jgi:hypothetical protein
MSLLTGLTDLMTRSHSHPVRGLSVVLPRCRFSRRGGCLVGISTIKVIGCRIIKIQKLIVAASQAPR